MRNRIAFAALFALLPFAPILAAEEGAPQKVWPVVDAELKPYKGKPTVFLDGKPTALPTYSPITWRGKFLQESGPYFFKHQMGAYFLGLPGLKNGKYWGDSPWWYADRISEIPVGPGVIDMDAQAQYILENDPAAMLIIRNGPCDTPTWRRLHPEAMAVSEDGERKDIPSLASDLWWENQAKATVATTRWCESRPWGGRILGYWYGMPVEGTHGMLVEHLLYDHGPAMHAKLRAFLKKKYKTDEAMRKAYGIDDPVVTLETISVPKDPLRGSVPEVSQILYFQPAAKNQRYRDYLQVVKTCFHEGLKKIFEAQTTATERKRLFFTDGFKQPMMGWSNWGFFHPKVSLPMAYPEMMSASGSMNVADLFGLAGLDGIITPHDYQVRGVGGVLEPEGAADSIVLRDKYFLVELDIRTYVDDREKGNYGTARDFREFEAILWRDVAACLTRGLNGYLMDLVGHWFDDENVHRAIGRAVEVQKASVEWEHETVPGIAMILDDASALETNGNGRVANECVMWEQKMGISRCGVPYRIYLLEDLALDHFPKHRVFYFPNLYRVDDERLALLKAKVLRDGNVVVFGPGAGISDGETLSVDHAARLTGFAYNWIPNNYSRRVMVTNFEHPITRGLPADTIYGSPLAYGPILFPKDGTELGLAWTKYGKNWVGLAVKEFGKGARNSKPEGETFGPGDYAAVVTNAAPVPAALWRGIARYAGAHVYCETNDILMADSSLVALHSIQSGDKALRLPGAYAVEDVVSGERVADTTDTIRFTLKAPETRVFRLLPPK